MIIGGSTFSPFSEPSYMPFSITAASSVRLWDNSAIKYANNNADFWTFFGYRGTVTDCDGLGANTYQTICDITGQGYFGRILLPQTSNDNWNTWTVRITVDGVEYMRVSPANINNKTNRVLMGYAYTIPAHASTTWSTALQDGWLTAWWGRKSGQSDSNDSKILWNPEDHVYPVLQQLTKGIPVCQFSSSLKVEFKTTLGIGANAYERNAGVTHMLTGDLS